MYSTWSTTTASTKAISESLTIEKLNEIARALPPEPYRELMMSRNCDPADGWVLVLPVAFRTDYPPAYVRFSPLIEEPVCINHAALGFVFVPNSSRG